MSNTSKGRGKKGSKFWMQVIINSKLSVELNRYLGEEVMWLSPLAEQDNYSEYELRQDYIAKKIGISKDKYSFWPNRQPQWDAIGMNKEGNVLYLVEAKANLRELVSKLSATNQLSIDTIMNTMGQVFNQQYPKGDFDKWINRYYQLGNRLTFLNKLNSMTDETGFKVKLVLLNLVNDYTYKPTPIEAWENHYKEVFKDMTGNENVPEDVALINYFVTNEGVSKSPVDDEWIYESILL